MKPVTEWAGMTDWVVAVITWSAFCPPLHSRASISSRPQPSRSFRPTRLLASPLISHHLHLHFFPSSFLHSFLPSSSVSPSLLCFSFLPASDSVTDSSYPWIPLVSSFLSARRPVAMVIQCDLRYVATNVDPK